MLSTYYKNDWFCFKKYLEYKIFWDDEKSLIICKCQFWREKKLFLLLNLANHLPQKLFFANCDSGEGCEFSLLVCCSNKQNLWRFRCCAPADVLSWERAFDWCHPYCLFVFSPSHPPVTCGKAFFASFAPPPIILLLRTYLDPIIVQKIWKMAPGLSCCSCQRMCCDGLDAMIGDINSHKFQIDIGRRDRLTFHNSYSSPNRKPATKNTKQQQGTKKTTNLL